MGPVCRRRQANPQRERNLVDFISYTLGMLLRGNRQETSVSLQALAGKDLPCDGEAVTALSGSSLPQLS